MKNLNIVCANILIESVELAILWELEIAFEITAFLALRIGSQIAKEKLDDVIFQNAMEWMIYLENKEHSDLKDKTPQEVLAIFYQIKADIQEKESR